ncbi:hypothetical protein FEM48_Zijuj12G0072500 [Ziziphus jujuba var. spinosa]|uniref:7,8-dihydroneopterin aldolase n=1 Tax=Ziziphus jujuba var. spinosa TaxID=714518 RepID=A0A978UBX5_ZIZJJ|nr:hypothetical protein FEM48_Zijuj12G0072500 [Ziziphus jujuba var. spinosa]
MEDAPIPRGDKLILRGLKFHGFHGVKPEERKLGQKFLVDVDAWMDLHPAGLSDRLADTISYTEIYDMVKEVIEGKPHNLLESVAQHIASTTLTTYPQISAVRVTVGKPHVCVQGPLDYLGVEILRYRRVGMEDAAIPKGDKLILRGLKFHGFHGVKPEERKLGQKFLVDVDAWMDLHPAGLSDRLSDTISYTEIYRIVKEVIEGQPHNLLESVAQLIASTTLTRYPQISAVRVSVGKPHVSVQGPLDCLGVEIHRYRSIHIPK